MISKKFHKIGGNFGEKLVEKLLAFTKSQYQNFSKFVSVTKIMAFSVLFSVTPFGTVAQPSSDNLSNLTVNFSNAYPLRSGGSIEIQKGVSIYDSTTPKQVKAVSYAKTENTQNLDPFRFRPVYYAAAERFNIPWQLIEAVHQVESGKSGDTPVRSYAGAQGPMQFMPGTWRAYQIDGDGDGKANINDVEDAIFTGAHYLARSGADAGRYEDALFNYNHSYSYVRLVLGIAREIGL